MKWVGIFSAAAAMLLGSATPPPAAADGALRAHTVKLAYADLSTLGEIDIVVAPPTEAEKIRWSQLDDVGRPQPCQNGLSCSGGQSFDKGIPGETQSIVRSAPVWTADPGNYGPIRVVISLPQQKAFVFQGSELIATSRVSTGKRGHETPVGTFPIMQKKVRHFSNIYDNAPMPYMQRLTNGGVALHAGHVPGYRASHGCIRLPWSFAKKLYGMTRNGTPVIVTNERVSIS
jgi:hypothetical protein